MFFLRLFLYAVLGATFPATAWAGQQYADCRICHKFTAQEAIVHPPVRAGCVSCHTEPHRKDARHSKGLRDEGTKLCLGCHNGYERRQGQFVHAPAAPGNPRGTCTLCHNPHGSENPKLLREAMPGLCYGCHGNGRFKGKVMHAPVSSGSCSLCHNPHIADNKGLLRNEAARLCFRCHSDAGFKGEVRHAVATSGKCTYCHEPHAAQHAFLLKDEENRVCAKCHSRFRSKFHKKTKKVRKNGRKPHPMSASPDPRRQDRNLSCSSCHEPHSSDYPRLFRYKAGTAQELCGHCHEPGRSASMKVKLK